MKRKKTFRAGQRVRLICDPQRTFRIDKSQVPDRIYHEKGSNRWWTRNELQHLGAPENPATSYRLNGKGRMRGTHPNASPTVRGGPQIVAEISSAGLKERKCLECGVRFRPTRRWQKFHAEGCRRAHWKRKSPATQAEQTLRAVV